MRLVLAVAAFALFACAPKRIPGTEIEDNKDTRAVLSLMEGYRRAVEAEDAAGIVKMLSPSFKDDGGSPSLDDDLDITNVQAQLTARFERIENVRLELEVKKVEVERDRARATYYWTMRYDAPTLTTRATSDSELKQMAFELVGEEWKILSGI